MCPRTATSTLISGRYAGLPAGLAGPVLAGETEVHQQNGSCCERWTEDDAEPMTRMNAKPRVMQRTGDGSSITPDQTAEEIARFGQRWEERGFGLSPRRQAL